MRAKPPPLRRARLAALALALASLELPACAEHGLEPGEAPTRDRGADRLEALLALASERPPARIHSGLRVGSLLDDETVASDAPPGGAVSLHRGVTVDVLADGATLEISSRRDGFPITLRRLGVPAASPRVQRSAAVVDAGPSANAAHVLAREHAVEDLLVVRDLDAALGYDVELPEGWRLARDSRRVVELVDPLGTPRLRLVAKEAWDARGRALRVGLRLEGPRRVLVDVDATGAELPLYVDPEIQDTGTVAFARSRNDLVLGLDGRAYVIGGDAEEPLPVEAFDPRTGRFDVLGPELPARERSAAVVLQDGRIALVGGRRRQAGAWQALDSLDLLDPRTGAVTDSLQLADPRAFHTVTRLLDGRLLIAGGERYLGDETQPLASSELFDPSEGSLVAGPPLAAPRSALSATRLEDGRILVAGGGDSAVPGLGVLARKSAELFDPETDSWAPIADDLVAARRLHAATLLHDGRVLLWGGLSTYIYDQPAELFDPALGTFTDADWWQSAADQPPSQLMIDGDLFSEGVTVDPETGIDPAVAWTSSYQAPATLLHDGRLLYVVGATAYLGLPEPEIARFESDPYAMPHRGDHAAALLPSGRVLLVGGHYAFDAGNGITEVAPQLQSVELEPVTGAVEAAGDLARARIFPTATLLPNGKVLVAGGLSPSGADNRVAELYDPVARAFEDADALQEDRAGHTATPLPNGDVLFVGGSEARLAERYVAASASFVAAGELLAPRNGHTATLLADGRVLIAGGGSAQLELYDPASSSFEAAGTLLQDRSGHGAALLPDGRVLLAGLAFTIGYGDQIAEIWDPVTQLSQPVAVSDDWVPISLRDPAVLWDGSVLFANGGIYRPGSERLERAWPYDYWEFPGRSVTRLLDGSVLVAGAFFGGDEPYAGTFQRLASREPFASRAPRLSSHPPAVGAGNAQQVEGLRLQGLSEASSGHTLASPVDPPVAVWLPIPEGTPVIGGVEDFDAQRATWRVPVTAFAGLGALHVVAAGLRGGGVPVFVASAEPGQACAHAAECGSGHCVDGLCCDRTCGPCEACTAEAKGGGADGVCGPRPPGAAPSSGEACPAEPLSTCGLSGVCDGLGRCAHFEDGTACLPGARCDAGQCAVEPPQCVGSEVVAGGTTVLDCAPFACTPELTCAETCASNLDCAATFVCSPEGSCEPAAAPNDPAASCAATPAPARGSSWGLGLLLLGAACARGRRSPGRGRRALALALLGFAGCSPRLIEDPPAGGQAPSAGGGGEGGLGGGAPPAPPPLCGNGVREGDEACDGDDLGSTSCAELGLTGGPPRCSYDCTVDATSCAGCGNGYVDPGEQCDGGPPPGSTCLSLASRDWINHVGSLFKGNLVPGDLSFGTPGCSADCTLDLTDCGYCYDGVITGDEVCDDLDGPLGDVFLPDLGGETCASLDPELSGDGVRCSYNCRFFFLGGCERPPPPPCLPGDNCSLVLGGSSLQIPQDSAVGLTLAEGSLTVEYWARIDDPGGCAVGAGTGAFSPNDLSSAQGREWTVGHGYTFDTVTLAARDGGDAPYQAAFAYSAIEADTWFHVAGVFDAEAGELRLYVDGQVAASEPYEPPLESAPLQSLWLGSPCYGNLPFRTWGRMDELRISRGARYDGPFAPQQVFAPDLDTLALYHFDEGSGEVAQDESGGARHALRPDSILDEPVLWAGEHP